MAITDRIATQLATSLDGLAGIYVHQGRYSKAEALCLRAVAVTGKALGPHHPDVAARLNHLINIYIREGKNVEAEQLRKKKIELPSM